MIGFTPLDRLQWLAKLGRDARISIGPMRVAAALADRMNGKTGQLNPSELIIAGDTGLTVRGVRKSTKALARLGYIEKLAGGGSGKTNHYILKNPEPLFPLSDKNPEPLFPLSDNKPGTTVPKTRNHCSQNPDAHLLDEQGKEQGIYCANAHAQNIAQNRFTDFWAAYPKKRDKVKACQIWKSKKLDILADHIIADIKNRLVKDGQWQDAQYIPYPTTYLRNERWEDETEQQATPKRKRNKFAC